MRKDKRKKAERGHYKEGDYERLANAIMGKSKKTQRKKRKRDRVAEDRGEEGKKTGTKGSSEKRDSWKNFGDFLKASKQKPIRIKDVAPHKDKRIVKEIRTHLMPAPPRIPFAALMQPMVIVPHDAAQKPIIADAGSIIKLMDQRSLYRDVASPITLRPDEVLVQYGRPDNPKLGWISYKHPSKSLKPSVGPTFSVSTKSEDELDAWDQLRLKIAQSRHKYPGMWLVPFLASYGDKHPQLLRKVTRFFGGKPIKNEDLDARCTRLFQLILHTEIDMAVAKKMKKAATKRVAKKSTAKKSKSSKRTAKTSAKAPAKKSRVTSARITKKDDDRVIIRLVKENPRTPGTKKAKIWDKLKKGMTVGEFTKKGGARNIVGRYIKYGWVKLGAAD